MNKILEGTWSWLSQLLTDRITNLPLSLNSRRDNCQFRKKVIIMPTSGGYLSMTIYCVTGCEKKLPVILPLWDVTVVFYDKGRPVQNHHFSDSNSIRFTHNFCKFNSYWILSTATHKSTQFFRFNSDNNKSRFYLFQCSTRPIQLNLQQPQLNSILDFHKLGPK